MHRKQSIVISPFIVLHKVLVEEKTRPRRCTGNAATRVYTSPHTHHFDLQTQAYILSSILIINMYALLRQTTLPPLVACFSLVGHRSPARH
jgi:hypothetical protein